MSFPPPVFAQAVPSAWMPFSLGQPGNAESLTRLCPLPGVAFGT